MVLMQPDIALAVARSLVRMTREGGVVPRWPLGHGYTHCMIGNHATQIVLDTVRKGVPGEFDVEVLWAALNRTATEATGWPLADLSDYERYGYCAADQNDWAASCTLAYAFDDWAMSELSDLLGKPQATVNYFAKRSLSYRKTFDPESRFFCPRFRNGTFSCPAEFAPELVQGGDKVGGYAEGDAWQWRWFVPGDVPGLIELLGGRKSFVKELETFFDKTPGFIGGTALVNPYYWAGNEPDILAPWLFSLAGRPDLTAKWTRWVLDRYYTTKPDGLPGNDDFGTLSAWAVWAWVGFYPLTGTDDYMLGSPRFPHIRIKPQGGGPVIDVRAHGASATAVYVSGCTWDGQNLTRPVLSHAALARGGALECWMTAAQGEAACVV